LPGTRWGTKGGQSTRIKRKRHRRGRKKKVYAPIRRNRLSSGLRDRTRRGGPKEIGAERKRKAKKGSEKA